MRISLDAYLRLKAWDVHLFETAEEFLSVEIPSTPSVVLIDVQLPRMSGLDLQARKGEISRSVPFVFMSGALSVTDGVAAMKGGAVEFLVKPVDPEELCQAVERALMQDAEFLEGQRRAADWVRQLEDLSPRERQVHELLLRGANNVQITNELGISINTAKQYKSEVMRKFGVSNLADLIAASARTNTTS